MGLLRRLARARLASRAVRRLRKAGFSDVRYDARAFQVRFTTNVHDEPRILDLTPLLQRGSKLGRGSGLGRGSQLDSYITGLQDPIPATWQQARPLLRPVLRGATPGSPLRRQALPYLFEYVVIDHPEAMTYVAEDQFNTWGVRRDEVFAAARANLEGATLRGTPTEVIRFVDNGDAYWTSHLLLEHWLEQLAPQVGGVPVAFAPERGTLLVTTTTSPHLRAVFAQAEELYARSSRPITPMAYVSDPHGCAEPWVPSPGHPLHHVARRAERILAVQEYARQAAHLTEPGAELHLTGDDDTGWRTYAEWDEQSLLPTADEVRVGDRTLSWPQLAPRLTPVAGLDPVRWRAADAPPHRPAPAPREPRPQPRSR